MLLPRIHPWPVPKGSLVLYLGQQVQNLGIPDAKALEIMQCFFCLALVAYGQIAIGKFKMQAVVLAFVLYQRRRDSMASVTLP
jgi:hypothetical protein